MDIAVLEPELRRAAPLFETSGSVLLLALALALLVLASLLSRIAQLGLRFGIDRGRRTARWASLLGYGGWLLLIATTARWLLAHFSFATGLLWTAGLFGLLAITGAFRDAAGTLLAQLRYRLSEGDHIRLGDVEGEIRGTHWDHLSLQAADGQDVLVPGRTLLSGVLRVQPLRDGLLFERTLDVQLSADALTRLSDTIAISAYRIPDTPMLVRPLDGDVRVSFYVWSRGGLAAAERQLLDTIEQVSMEEAPAADP